MTNRRFPKYPNDTDYTTNSPSYYDDLARKQHLIKLLAERIWEYENTLNESLEHIEQRLTDYILENDALMTERLENWDQRIDEMPEEMRSLFVAWLEDGTLEKIINHDVLGNKADQSELDKTNDQLEKTNDQLEKTNDQLEKTNMNIKDRGINLNTSFPRQPTENNDSPRIQRAIDSLGMNGGLLFFPEGIYELSEPVTFDARNLILAGMGRKSVLRPSESFTGNSLIRSLHATDRTRLNALENVIIERLTFDGRQKEIIGVLITGFNRGCSIRDNTFNNFEGSSINLTGSWSYSIERNNITGSNKNGIGLDLGNGGYGGYDNSHVVNQSRIVGNTIRGHDTGIDIGYGNNNLIQGNTIELNKRNLVSLSSNSLVVIGNYFELCTTESIRLGGVTSTVKDSMFQGNFFFMGENATAEFTLVGVENTIISNNQYYPTGRVMFIPESRGVIQNNTIEVDASRVLGLQHINQLNTLINVTTKKINKILADNLKVDLSDGRTLESIDNGIKIQGSAPRFELNGIPPTGESDSTGEIRMVSEDGTTLARLGKLTSESNTFSMYLDGLNKFLFNKAVQINAPVGFNGVEPQTKKTITGETDSEKIDNIIQVLTDFGLVE